MKYLAIDYGQKRTGIAVTDAGGSMAFPRCTVQMRGKDVFMEEIILLIEQEKADALVVGLPVRGDGTDSETTRQVRNMVERLQQRTTLPIYLMEETLSSYDASLRLREAGYNGRNMGKKLDQAAAVAILESFLTLTQEQRIPL